MGKVIACRISFEKLGKREKVSLTAVNKKECYADISNPLSTITADKLV